jgi:hypothetical protein
VLNEWKLSRGIRPRCRDGCTCCRRTSEIPDGRVSSESLLEYGPRRQRQKETTAPAENSVCHATETSSPMTHALGPQNPPLLSASRKIA